MWGCWWAARAGPGGGWLVGDTHTEDPGGRGGSHGAGGPRRARGRTPLRVSVCGG